MCPRLVGLHQDPAAPRALQHKDAAQAFVFSNQKKRLLVVVLLLQEFAAKHKNSQRALLMFWIVLNSAYTWTQGELI